VLRILEPPVLEPVKVKPEPKPPARVTRIPVIERNIAMGLEMLELRASIICNKEFGRAMRKRGVDPVQATEAMRVARLYAGRPEIYRALSLNALFELSSPKMAPAVWQRLEADVIAGKNVTAKQIRKARGRLKGGSLKRTIQQPSRMAA
jgi:hypothetical protein